MEGSPLDEMEPGSEGHESLSLSESPVFERRSDSALNDAADMRLPRPHVHPGPAEEVEHALERNESLEFPEMLFQRRSDSAFDHTASMRLPRPRSGPAPGAAMQSMTSRPATTSSHGLELGETLLLLMVRPMVAASRRMEPGE